MSEWVERADRLSLDVLRARLPLPAIEQRALADQVRRASKSICANLAEGFGRQRMSRPEFGRFLDDGDRFGRRNAGVDPVLPRSRLYRRRRRRALAGRSTGRLPGCSGACGAAVLITDF